MSKIKVYHFHNGKSGGVHSVISNLIKFSGNPLIENHIIYTINKDRSNANAITKIEGAVSERVFYYSAKWNFYYTCKQLAKLLPGGNAMIIAHDWIELGMVSNLGLQNPVVQFVHGAYDYYYELAERHEMVIDLFIAVAQDIEVKLKNLLTYRTKDISYLRFPVPANNYVRKETPGVLNIIFVGRLQPGKGYHLLPEIAKLMDQENIVVTWHIVGVADENDRENITWDPNISIKFYGNIPNAEVLKLLAEMQILLLPSMAEGMPVGVIEAMKAGVIPIANNIDGGIRELITDYKTGFRIKEYMAERYAEKIVEISANKDLLISMQKNCIVLANELFDPVNNTRVIEEAFAKVYASERVVKPVQKIYGSRLDESWIPNWTTSIMRSFYK